MATPNADRLRAINEWNPGLIEHTNQTLGKISGRLQTIAEVNRRVAADLGIEGEAAESASALSRSKTTSSKAAAGLRTKANRFKQTSTR